MNLNKKKDEKVNQYLNKIMNRGWKPPLSTVKRENISLLK